MTVKEDLKTLIMEILHERASTIFLKRAADVIDASGDDSESILSAVRKVSCRVAIFIDETLAESVQQKLLKKIGASDAADRAV